MGGNALKNTETRRIPKQEYDQVWKEIETIFLDMGILPCDLHLIQSYSSKADFGDMDILITEKGQTKAEWTDQNELKDLFKTIFGSNEVIFNGSCVSFDYKGFQIDLITCPYDEFQMSATYFAFNDLGNLIGKTARNLHLKYGHKGLYHTVRDGIGEKVGEVLISRKPREIFAFLGYDWERWRKGFKDLEEIFQFAVSSKYFTAESYALDNLNHVDRIRDKKRATYTAFLDWLEKNKPTSNFVRPEDRNSMLGLVREAFPDFGRRYDMAWVNVNKMADVKRKFNGNIVSHLTGLEKKELGLCMEKFRTSFESEAQFQDYVLYSSPTTLADEIKRIGLSTPT